MLAVGQYLDAETTTRGNIRFDAETKRPSLYSCVAFLSRQRIIDRDGIFQTF